MLVFMKMYTLTVFKTSGQDLGYYLLYICFYIQLTCIYLLHCLNQLFYHVIIIKKIYVSV